MKVIKADEGWRAMYLLQENEVGYTPTGYLPCGLAYTLTEILVLVEGIDDESLVGFDLEPVGDQYSYEDYAHAPHTALGFVGYLPPEADPSFYDERAQTVSRESRNWIRS